MHFYRENNLYQTAKRFLLNTKTIHSTPRPYAQHQDHTLNTKTIRSTPRPYAQHQDHTLNTKTIRSTPRPYAQHQDHTLNTKTIRSAPRPYAQDHTLNTKTIRHWVADKEKIKKSKNASERVNHARRCQFPEVHILIRHMVPYRLGLSVHAPNNQSVRYVEY